MKLRSRKNTTEIEITRVDYTDPYAGFLVTVCVHDREGEFSAFNNRLHFSDYSWAVLEEFFLSRKESVELRCTEDCTIEFYPWNKKRDVGVRYKIGKYLFEEDPDRTASTHLCGSFVLDSEFINSTMKELRQTLDV
jgi:hypothetical protein